MNFNASISYGGQRPLTWASFGLQGWTQRPLAPGSCHRPETCRPYQWRNSFGHLPAWANRLINWQSWSISGTKFYLAHPHTSSPLWMSNTGGGGGGGGGGAGGSSSVKARVLQKNALLGRMHSSTPNRSYQDSRFKLNGLDTTGPRLGPR
jgi:hypothetical protein